MSKGHSLTPEKTWLERAAITLPFALTLIFFLLNSITFPHISLSVIKPPLLLITVYFWALYRPSIMPIWLSCSLGLMLDILLYVPLGLHVYAFVLIHIFMMFQRRFLSSQSFLIVWLGFTLVFTGFIAAAYTPYLVRGHSTDWLFVALSYAGGIFIFPPVAALLHMVHTLMPALTASPKSIAMEKLYAAKLG